MGKAKMDDDIFEALLKIAVIEYCYEECSDYPMEEELKDLDDSKYDPIIQKLIRNFGKKVIVEKIYHASVKAASVILIVIGTSFLCLLQVDEIRASCISYIKTIYEKFIQYDFFSEEVSLKRDFSVEFVPAGYTLVFEQESSFSAKKVYENDDMMKLSIDYYASKNFTSQMDNENCIINDFIINGAECQSFIYDNGKTNQLTMSSETGLIIISGQISEVELKKIAENIK